MLDSTKLLSVIAVVFFHMLFSVAMLEHGLLPHAIPRLLLLYQIAVALFGALYTQRRLWLRHQRGGLYHGLGDTAVMLFASMVAVVFNGVDLGVSLPVATAVRLVAPVVAAYFLYRIIIRPLEEEAPQVHVDVLAIV